MNSRYCGAKLHTARRAVREQRAKRVAIYQPALTERVAYGAHSPWGAGSTMVPRVVETTQGSKLTILELRTTKKRVIGLNIVLRVF